jgi:hypothetical protein
MPKPPHYPGYPYTSNYPVLPPGYPIQAQPIAGGMPYSAGYAGIPQSSISLAAAYQLQHELLFCSNNLLPSSYYYGSTNWPTSDNHDALHFVPDAGFAVPCVVVGAVCTRWKSNSNGSIGSVACSHKQPRLGAEWYDTIVGNRDGSECCGSEFGSNTSND